MAWCRGVGTHTTLVIWTTAPLLAIYAMEPALPTKPSALAMLMTIPHSQHQGAASGRQDLLILHPRSCPKIGSCFSICAAAYLHPRNTPLALIFQDASTSATSTSCVLSHLSRRASKETPALLTSLSLIRRLLENGTAVVAHIEPAMFRDSLAY